MSLSDEHCQSCEGGIASMDAVAARERLTELSPEWRLEPDGRSIVRDFKFKDFYRTMGFVNAVAYIANREDHHPDLEVGYSTCRVRYTTHAIKGLSLNDFICAAKIDRLA
jgi:4a-hydroxytetrahydrobiopterin dehydratase